MKTAPVHSRIQPEVEKGQKKGFTVWDSSPTEAIRMFYAQIALRNGWPFDVAIPNEVTEKGLDESSSGRDLERFDSVDQLF